MCHALQLLCLLAALCGTLLAVFECLLDVCDVLIEGSGCVVGHTDYMPRLLCVSYLTSLTFTDRAHCATCHGHLCVSPDLTSSLATRHVYLVGTDPPADYLHVRLLGCH